MRLKLRDMDDNTWITADDRKIKVYDMDAVHLENTILFLRKIEFEIKLSILHTMQEYMQNAPDGAAECCQLEMNAIEKMSIDEFLILAVKPYKKMLERYSKELEKIN